MPKKKKVKPGKGREKRERRAARKKAEKQANMGETGGQTAANAVSKPGKEVDTSNLGVTKKIKKNRRPKKNNALKCTVFLGQLPWNTTKENISSAIGKVGVKNAKIRMLYDKQSEHFRGMAFVDVESEKDRTKLLDLHHSKILGREINVEKANMGAARREQQGTEEEGSAQPDRLRFQQHLTETEVWTIVEEAIEASEGLLREDDFDEKNCSFLGLLQADVAQKALEQTAKGFKAAKDKIRNRQAYVMGIIEKVSQKQHALKLKAGAKTS